MIQDMCRFVYTKIEDMFAICLVTSLHNVWRHVYTMCTLMFIPYFSTCFHHIWRFAYVMWEDMCAICLETSFNHVLRHVSTKSEDMFTPCLIAYLCIVWCMFTQYLKTNSDYFWRDIFVTFEDILWLYPVWKPVYTMYEDIIITFFRLIYIIFQGIFTPCMKTCLHKDTQLITF